MVEGRYAIMGVWGCGAGGRASRTTETVETVATCFTIIGSEEASTNVSSVCKCNFLSRHQLLSAIQYQTLTSTTVCDVCKVCGSTRVINVW